MAATTNLKREGEEMSEAKHTPGPWVTNERKRGTFATIDDAEPFPIVQVDHKGNCPHATICELQIGEIDQRTGISDVLRIIGSEEAQANARLIAAAPKLLEALIEMEDMFARRIDGREGPDDAADRWDAARDAIAKATETN